MDLTDKIKQIKDLEAEFQVEKENAYKKYYKLRDKVANLYTKIFNFEGQYLKIKHSVYDDAYTFMYCDRVRKSQNINNEDVVNLHGYGFEYEITEYDDDTFVHWTEWMDRDFKTYDVVNELKRIEVISKSEFNDEFYKMISLLTKKHEENIEYYEK
jgi:hypothetical protein